MWRQEAVHPWNVEVWWSEGLSWWFWWRQLPQHHHQVSTAWPHMWQFHSVCPTRYPLWPPQPLQGWQWWGRALWLVTLCGHVIHSFLLQGDGFNLVVGGLDLFIEWKNWIIMNFYGKVIYLFKENLISFETSCIHVLFNLGKIFLRRPGLEHLSLVFPLNATVDINPWVWHNRLFMMSCFTKSTNTVQLYMIVKDGRQYNTHIERKLN